LVALAWVGRGTYSAEQFDEAVEMAKSERVTATEDYLLGIPLLGDYLAEELEKWAPPQLTRKMSCSDTKKSRFRPRLRDRAPTIVEGAEDFAATADSLGQRRTLSRLAKAR
jgi:Protein of unknown function (DUF3775)